jgi:hypothetical protein
MIKLIKNFFTSIRSKFIKKESQNRSLELFLLTKESYEDFYSTIKLKTGEEIFAKVMPSVENKKITLLLSNPITVTELTGKRGFGGYKIEPWLKTSDDDLFLIDIEDVMTLSENKDNQMIHMHSSFSRKTNNSKKDRQTASRKMGYISNVDDAKKLLEELYNNS